MDNTWIKSYRKAQNHEIWNDKNAWRVFQWIIWNVDYKTGKNNFTRKQIAIGTGLKEATVYKVTTKLQQKYSAINIKSNNKNSEISVRNWARYQQYDEKVTGDGREKEQQTGEKSNNAYIYKEIKNIRNKEIKSTTYSSPLAADFSIFLEEFNKLFSTNFQNTPSRRKKYATRRKTFTGEQINIALINLGKSGFHRGENDNGWRADPDFILRSDEQIDKWINYKPKEEKAMFVKI